MTDSYDYTDHDVTIIHGIILYAYWMHSSISYDYFKLHVQCKNMIE